MALPVEGFPGDSARLMMWRAAPFSCFVGFVVPLILCPPNESGASPQVAIAKGTENTEAVVGRVAVRNGELGEPDEAASLHLAAAEAARLRGDADDELRQRVLLAEARQAQGRFDAAAETLALALQLATASGDVRRIAAVRGALGNVFVALGRHHDAQRELTGALSLARDADAVALAASLANNLGNFMAIRSEDAVDGPSRHSFRRRGIRQYVDALADARTAKDGALEARILANHARLALSDGQIEKAEALLQDALEALSEIAASRENVATRVHIGRSYQILFEKVDRPSPELLLRASALLTEAIDQAGELGDPRGAAWAQGTLGGIYAARGHTKEALELVRRALFDAQRAGATDAILRFEIESARLFVALNRESAAIDAYRQVVERLAEMRPILRISYAADTRSLYRESGQVYREMVDLLLIRAARGGPTETSDLAYVQQLMERFKADELRDYFQDDCVDAYRERFTDAGDPSLGAIVVYPIVLEDRLELLLTHQGKLNQYTVPISADTLNREVRMLRSLLEKRVTRQFLPHSQIVYDWLVRPYEALLERNRDATLVFVPDGLLRTIPMAALHDGEKFLIERHPVAVTPSLELSDPHPIEHSGAEVFLGGLSESVQGFSALPHVRNELTAVGNMYESEVLLNAAFVEEAIKVRISSRPYSVVHLASHGQLGARSQDSYLLTHDGKLELDELSTLLATTRFRDQPLELLTLSACETAAGDELSALGLSGLAVRAGARSVLGSLWKVNDEAASKLMITFYRELRRPGVSRAVALQRAQRALLNDSSYLHPGYWSPYLMVGNWL